jgi:hypothetical protein
MDIHRSRELEERNLLITWQVEQKVCLNKGFGLWMEEGNIFVFETGEKAGWKMSWGGNDNQVWRTTTESAGYNYISTCSTTISD